MEPTTINATKRRRTRPGTTRRIVTRVLLCLLLGAVTNVAVAWGVALKGGVFRDASFTSSKYTRVAYEPRSGQIYTYAHAHERTGLESHDVVVRECWEFPADPRLRGLPVDPNSWMSELTFLPKPPVRLGEWRSADFEHIECWFGLPWRAMWCENAGIGYGPERCLLGTPWRRVGVQVTVTSGAGGSTSIRTLHAFETPWYGVPLGVLPIGFTMNTLFWGAVWAGVLTLVPALRRRGRRERGECVRCRYARVGLADNAACPECGHAA